MAPGTAQAGGSRHPRRVACNSVLPTRYFESSISKVEQITNEIRCTYSDIEINKLLSEIPLSAAAFSRHFNQTEEFFLRFERSFTVPRLPIHHDVRRPKPADGYLESLKSTLSQLLVLAPQIFRDLTYLFDPAEILKPCFFKIYRIGEDQYLYLLRLDFMYRPLAHTIIEKGSNDYTAHYLSRQLFLEARHIPLSGVELEGGKVGSFRIRQSISNTWVDEKGRGYFVQGIWIDNELTKFFSKLFLPPGKRTYPLYPYVCQYKTVCLAEFNLTSESRTTYLPYLHRALKFLEPAMGYIEDSMKDQDFSESNETFRRLKEKIPESWYTIWQPLSLEFYLNEQDMKEFRIED